MSQIEPCCQTSVTLLLTCCWQLNNLKLVIERNAIKMSKSRHKKPVSQYSVTEIKHLLGVDTLSERLLLRRLLAASKLHLTLLS